MFTLMYHPSLGHNTFCALLLQSDCFVDATWTLVIATSVALPLVDLFDAFRRSCDLLPEGGVTAPERNTIEFWLLCTVDLLQILRPSI